MPNTIITLEEVKATYAKSIIFAEEAGQSERKIAWASIAQAAATMALALVEEKKLSQRAYEYTEKNRMDI